MSKQIRKSFVFDVDGYHVRIDNYFNSYHYGFSHTSRFFIGDIFQSEHVCGYINRTWECYDYQSSATGAVEQAIENITADCKNSYKLAHGIQRMTKRHQENFAAELKNNSVYNLYQKIKTVLSGYGRNFQTIWY